MISNYPIGLPGYHVPGMTLQTGVPLIAQQPPAMQPAPSAATNNSDLLEFSQMIADTKVGMSKIDMKLDEVLKRVDSIKESPSNAVVPLATPDTTSIIDPNIVLSSINKVVEESKALKQELLDRDTRIESLNHKVRQMMENNQRYVEQSQHMMEQRSDSLHSLSSANSSQIIRLQEENSSLKAKAEGAKRKLESRNFEFGETENDVNEMKKRNELLTQKMNVARTKFREKEGEIEELKNEIEKIQREAGREKTARQSTQRETNDLKETIGELRENIRTERQSKKRVQSNLSKIEEELGEVKAERDVMTSTIEDRRRKQQNEKSKLIREMEELKRSHEEELSLLKIQLQQSTGPSQVEMTKIEANWKRKMQLEISKNASTFDERIEELESNELRFKSQIQRLEKKVTNLSIENSTLQKENNRALEELDEFEGVKIREASSQELIERQNSMIEELIRGENELKSCVRTLEESEKGLMDEIQTLGEKNRELESRDESDGDEWRNHVKHVMNKFYASIQVEFPQQNTFTGGQVQTLVKAAITVETMRALNPDLDSTASGTPSEDSLEQVNPAGSPQLHLSSLSPQLTTHVLTGSNEPSRVDSPTPNSPLRIDSPTPNSPLRVDSPTPNSPLRVDSPTPNSPLRVDSPTPNSPLRVDSPTPNSPLRVDSPTPNSPLRVDSPTPNTSLRIDSPTPNSAILQTSPPLRHSPILQLESPRTQSPTLLTSPLSHSPPQTSMPDSPTLETAPPIEQSPKQTSPLSQIPLSQPYMDTSTPGPLSFQIPDRKSLNTFVSLDDENSVERSQISSDLMDTGICNTVVPMTIDSLRPSSTNSSQSPTFDTPSQSPDNILPTQTLDLSPSASPVPFQTRTNQSPSPPPIPPSTPPITNTPTATGSTQPDISDTIQVYDATVPPTTRSPPSLSPAHSPPPDISRYTSVPSHSSTPPPMGTDAPDGGELPITGNFSPDLLERHFSDRDKTSDGENELLDQSLPMQITPPIETQFNYPTVKDPLGMMVDKDPLENSADKNPLENNVVEDPLGIAVDKDSSENAANEDLEKTDAKISNPLLDNSSDSESDIFASMKRNTNVVEDEKSAPNSSSVQPQAPKSSIFGDSDDDLDWLS